MNYLDKLNTENMIKWIKKKTSIPSSKVTSKD